MMVRRKLLTVCVSVIVLAAIAAFAISRPPPVWVTRLLLERRFLQAPVDKVVASWGRPSETKVLDNGDTLLTWTITSFTEVPDSTPGALEGTIGTKAGFGLLPTSCGFAVKTDKSSKLVEDVKATINPNRDDCEVFLYMDQSKPRRPGELSHEFLPPPSSTAP